MRRDRSLSELEPRPYPSGNERLSEAIDSVLYAAMGVGSLLLEARELVLVPCSDLFLPALEVFRSQGDRGLSFVDAAIVAEARRLDSGRVATFDRAFDGIDGVEVVGSAE